LSVVTLFTTDQQFSSYSTVRFQTFSEIPAQTIMTHANKHEGKWAQRQRVIDHEQECQ